MPHRPPSPASHVPEAGARRLLLHLARRGAYARCDPFDAGRLTLVGPSRGVAAPAGFVPAGAARDLIERGLVAWVAAGGGGADRLVASRVSTLR